MLMIQYNGLDGQDDDDGASQCNALQGIIILNMVICWITIINRVFNKLLLFEIMRLFLVLWAS